MKKLTLISALLIFAFSNTILAQTATEIIKKAEENAEGKSNYVEMTMKIIRPKWTRTIAFKSVSIENKYSMTLITSPNKEKGQTFMKRQNDLWSYSPKINRFIKLPPSMMSQGWMGSDLSNDDLMKESSLIRDYSHILIKTETVSGKECYKIELIPTDEDDAFWGKLEIWISKDNFLQLKTKYYDDDLELIRTEIASNIKNMDGRQLPTHMEITPAEEPNNKTIININKIKFNPNVKESFFSQQTMKRGMRIVFPQ